ncbi:MAG: alpha/beta hydrolase [Opitutaceae bacterium]|nr:alpha/beta hydrolase [Opitutaceae bacterium]
MRSPRLHLALTIVGLSTLLPVSAAERASYDLKENLAYYDESVRATDDYLAERCVLDLYHPTNADGYATVVWFHGGGLQNGNKSIAERLQNQGIAVAAVNYRLSPQATSPAYLEDSAAAVAWVFKNIAQYGGNPDKIFVSGSSAGGYLTSMLGLDKSWLAAHDIDADRIAGLIPLAGQTLTHFTIRTERGLPRERPVIDELAPLHHIRADTPPILLVTGDREMEMLGRYEENAYFYRMLKVAGHPDVRLMELDGYGHAPHEPFYPLLLREIKRVLAKKN